MITKLFYIVISIINFPTFWMFATATDARFIASGCFILSIIIFFAWVDYDAKKTSLSEKIIIEIPKSLIEDLRREFKLPQTTNNEDVLKNAVLTGKHAARNGFFVIDKNKPAVPIPFGPIYGGRN